jgi:farnesyl-diphosphate farnesyltransferase
MQNVKEPSLFSFCAIPQVMAIATTELIFQNPKMFNVGTVKLRRGTTAKLVLESQTMAGVFAVFREYTMRIHLRNRADDPNFMRIEVLCGKIQQYIDKQTIVESFKQQKINEAQTAKNKDQFSDNLVLLSALAVLFFTCGLMAFIGYLGGARYDLVYEQVLDFFYEFQHGPGNIRPNSPYQSHVQSISAAAAQTAIGHADL